MKRLVPLLIVILIAATALAPQAAYADLSTGLQAYWKFDESSGNASDSTANANTLTNTNTATFSTGLINNAAYLTAASTMYFTKSDTASLSVTGDITINVWIYVTASPVQSTRTVIVNKEGSYLLTLDRNKTVDGAVEDIGVQLNTTGANAGMISGGYVTTGSAGDGLISLNTWHMITFTRIQSSGADSFYIDGVANNPQTHAAGTAITDTANAYEQGRGVNVFLNGTYYTNAYFDGRMDETSIYNVALAASDITTLYNAGKGCQYTFSACSGATIPRVQVNSEVIVGSQYYW